MADTKISNLTALAAAPDSGDFFALVDTSASATKKLDAKYLVRDSGGSGAKVTGAYTLTLPATGTAALLATANTFTAAQVIDVAAGVGLTVEGASGEDVLSVKTASGAEAFAVDSAGSINVGVAGFAVADCLVINQSLAAGGILSLSSRTALLIVMDDSGGRVGLFAITKGLNTVASIYASGGMGTNSATADNIAVYYDSGYKIKNTWASTRNIAVWMIRAG